MKARYFESAEAMADYQVEREVQEALRVSAMSSSERFKWLTENWDPLQAAVNVLYAKLPKQVATARCYTTIEEKNRFDEDREIDLAIQMQIAN